jgi:hypothetical protein
MKKIGLPPLIAIILAVCIGVFLPASQVNALPGGVSFREGYFNGLTISNNNIDPVLNQDCGDPFDSSMVDKLKFIDRIMQYYDGKCSKAAQNSLGAEFIMRTMLNNRGPIDIDDWKDHVNSSDITIYWVEDATFEYNSGCYSNSGCSSGTGLDDYFVNTSGGHDGLVFYSTSAGEVVYQLKSNCGNPVGSTVVLGWTITPLVSADRTTAKPGETIKWRHTVVNNGPNATDKQVKYRYHNAKDLGTGYGSYEYVAAGWGSGQSQAKYFDSFYTVKDSDKGKSLCRSTEAKPRGKDDSSAIQSGTACVTVPNDAVGTDCRPTINITVPVAPDKYIGGPNDTDDPAPVTVKISGEKIGGTYTKETTIDLAKDYPDLYYDYTDGDDHEVSYTATYYKWTHYDSDGDGIKDDHKYVSKSFNESDAFQCYDYKLTPNNVSLSSNRLEVGSLLELGASVESDSYSNIVADGKALHTKSKDTTWQLSQITIYPDSGDPKSVSGQEVFGGDDGDDPCSHYTSSYLGVSSRSCSTAKEIRTADSNATASYSLDGETVFSKSGNPDDDIDGYTLVDDSYPPGTVVCYALSLFARTSEPKGGKYRENRSYISSNDVDTDGGSWIHSAIDKTKNCMVVVKKPKVQVLGGDILAGRTFSGTSSSSSKVVSSNSVKKLSNKTGVRLFGSWAEYGILASSQIFGFASSSAFNGTSTSGDYALGSGLVLYPKTNGSANTTLGTNISNDIKCGYSRLSFNNASSSSGCSGDNIGNYSNKMNIPDVLSKFQSSKSIFDGGTISNSYYGVYKANKDITISGGTIEKTKWVVINASGHKVTISDNINYSSDTIFKTYEIPQLVIIADDIDISQSVTNIDSWLIARNGNINTCYQAGTDSAITVKNCNSALVVNGPVMANKIYLRRTAGSGTQMNSGNPAETFNLRADAYLWAYERARDGASMQTTYVIEQPPRY